MSLSTLRMVSMLNHLDEKTAKAPPKGVGLKTLIQAREAGFVIIDDVQRRPLMARLTPEGTLYRNRILLRRK